MSTANRLCLVAVSAVTLILAHASAIAQYTITVPAQNNYYRNPPILYSNRAAILGRALEQTYDIHQQQQQQYQQAAQDAAYQRQLYLADQENRARYLQQQNEQRLQYQQQLQIQQQQQQYGYANSTPSYPAPRAPISSFQQNQYVQQWYNQYQSRQATVSQWGQAPLPTPNYQPARRICSNGQFSWYC